MAGLCNQILKDKKVSDPGSAVAFLMKAAATPGFQVHFISLRDLHHSSDEGNTSIQFNSSVPKESIMEELRARSIDRIFLMGSYRGTMTGIGIDLATYEITVSVPDNEKNIVKELVS